ncbi:hypothetical protein [Amycolatopsis sp. cmx-4-83]|uniref:hypothetical protein n=1 Tax=Amycolatopsis sp. cmx-4-83 TaxID=2790940 RepID=UPI00397E0C9E
MGGGVPRPIDAAMAVQWLARHGVVVGTPVPLLSLRLGVRERMRTKHPGVGLAVGLVIAFVNTFGMEVAHEAFGDLAVGSGFILGALVVVAQVWRWVTVRESDRPAAALVRPAARPALSWTLGLLGAWYLTSAVVAYAGGLVLFLALAPSAAPFWLGLLALGAVQSGFVWWSVLREPVVAVDPASFMVDAVLRVEDAHSYAAPAVLPYLACGDLLFAVPVPPSSRPAVVAYAVLAVGTQVVGWVLHRRRSRVLRPTLAVVPR